MTLALRVQIKDFSNAKNHNFLTALDEIVAKFLATYSGNDEFPSGMFRCRSFQNKIMIVSKHEILALSLQHLAN